MNSCEKLVCSHGSVLHLCWKQITGGICCVHNTSARFPANSDVETVGCSQEAAKINVWGMKNKIKPDRDTINHPSTFFDLSRTGQPKQRSPDVPVPGHLLQLIWGNTKAFPHKPKRYNLSSVSWWDLPGKPHLGNPQRHPCQMPKPLKWVNSLPSL